MTDPFVEALKKHGLGEVTVAADGAKIIGYLDTGNFGLNWTISNKFLGGWPLGYVAEIFGDPSTGKSYLVARAIASALMAKGVALLDDTEGAFNAVWAEQKLGVDTTRLAYRRSDTVKAHMEVVQAYIKALKAVQAMKIEVGPSILALDSLALLTTEHEREVGLSKVSLTRAKELRTMFRVVGAEMSGIPAVYLIANHTIANIGDMFAPTTTPGGGGPKFQASIRLELRKASKVKQGDTIVGVRVRAFVEKNRFAVPWRVTDLVIPFFEPISPYSGLISLLLDLEVLKVQGRSLVLRGEDTKIPANKSDLLKQDRSAKMLLEKYPDLLKELDSGPGLGIVKVDLDSATEDASSDSS